MSSGPPAESGSPGYGSDQDPRPSGRLAHHLPSLPIRSPGSSAGAVAAAKMREARARASELPPLPPSRGSYRLFLSPPHTLTLRGRSRCS